MQLFQGFSTRLCTIILISLLPAIAARAQLRDSPGTVKSKWVYFNPQGRLEYKTLKRGDRIMDFSYAGYMGGGVSLPSPPVKITLSPAPGDNTDEIQHTIDQVSRMGLTDGFRGAVLLSPGVYSCERTILIRQSGVVLRGSGSGENGTILQMTGDPHTCIIVRGDPGSKTAGNTFTISDSYVPSGSDTLSLNNASELAAGDTILISRPVTTAWVKFMGMDNLTRNGKKQTWINGDITTERVIGQIEKNKITVDVPLTDSYDAAYTAPSGVSVTKIITSGTVTNVGVENMRIVSPSQEVSISERHNSALAVRGISDGWVRNLAIFNTVNSISITGKRITVDNVSILHDLPTLGAAKPADLNGSGSQILFNHCYIKGDNLFFFATGAKVSGPVVLLNCVFRGNGWIQPHQRWATGLLVDNCRVPAGGIDFMNRGEMGSGHGWTIGWAVAWNCVAASFVNQRPPGSTDWMIGCRGERQRKAMPFNKLPLLSEGIYDAYGTPVNPPSLYLAQLAERLGEKAVKNTGY